MSPRSYLDNNQSNAEQHEDDSQQRNLRKEGPAEKQRQYQPSQSNPVRNVVHRDKSPLGSKAFDLKAVYLTPHRHQPLFRSLEFLRPFGDGLRFARRLNVAEPHGLGVGAKDQNGPPHQIRANRLFSSIQNPSEASPQTNESKLDSSATCFVQSRTLDKLLILLVRAKRPGPGGGPQD